MDAVQAWEQVNDPQYCGRLDMVGLERLLLRAGWSPEAAHKAALKRAWDRMTNGEAI